MKLQLATITERIMKVFNDWKHTSAVATFFDATTAQAAIDRENEHEQNVISGQAPNPRESQPEFEKKVLVG